MYTSLMISWCRDYHEQGAGPKRSTCMQTAAHCGGWPAVLIANSGILGRQSHGSFHLNAYALYRRLSQAPSLVTPGHDQGPCPCGRGPSNRKSTGRAEIWWQQSARPTQVATVLRVPCMDLIRLSNGQYRLKRLRSVQRAMVGHFPIDLWTKGPSTI
jgi:hypothetical protein